MKYAIISDIHSNLEALTKTLGIIDESGVDEIVCLGDIVGYGANPNECVALVQKRCSKIVIGNHDVAAIDPSVAEDFNPIAKKAVIWTSQELSDASKQFLSALPYQIKAEPALFVHSSPQEPEAWNYIINAEDAIAALRYCNEKICFIGHTHVPGIFSKRGRAKFITTDEQFLVNVGSVGQPRDGNPMLAFGIFDTEQWSYEQMRSDYEIQLASDKIFKAGLPEELGYRLMYGV
jgi:predicted phosphodiesterase